MEILEGFELIFLMHVVFGHDLLELGARHVHTTPSVIQVNGGSYMSDNICEDS